MILRFTVCVAAGFGMFFVLYDSLPSDFVIPVIVYCTAIVAMSTKALGRSTLMFGSASVQAAIAGSVSFVISDSVLSYSLFKASFPFSRQVVMTTYYAAQLLIALSACDFYARPSLKLN